MHALPQSAKLSMILNMYTETFCCNGMVFYYLWGGGGGCRGGVILKILTVLFGEGGHFQIRERYRGLGYFNRFHETNTSTKERELRINVTVNNNGKHRPLIINVVNFGPIFNKNIALQFPQQSGGSQFHLVYTFMGGGGYF